MSYNFGADCYRPGEASRRDSESFRRSSHGHGSEHIESDRPQPPSRPHSAKPQAVSRQNSTRTNASAASSAPRSSSRPRDAPHANTDHVGNYSAHDLLVVLKNLLTASLDAGRALEQKNNSQQLLESLNEGLKKRENFKNFTSYVEEAESKVLKAEQNYKENSAQESQSRSYFEDLLHAFVRTLDSLVQPRDAQNLSALEKAHQQIKIHLDDTSEGIGQLKQANKTREEADQRQKDAMEDMKERFQALAKTTLERSKAAETTNSQALDLVKALEKSNQEYQRKLEELSRSIESQNDKIQQLASRNDALEKDLNNANKKVQDDVTHLRSYVDDIKIEVDGNRDVDGDVIKKLMGRVDHLTTTHVNSGSTSRQYDPKEITALEEQVRKLLDRPSEEAAVAALDKRIKEMEIELYGQGNQDDQDYKPGICLWSVNAEEGITNILENLKNVDEAIGEHDTKLDTQETSISSLRSELLSKGTELQEQTRNVFMQQAKIFEEDISRLGNSNNEVMKELEKQSKDIEKLFRQGIPPAQEKTADLSPLTKRLEAIENANNHLRTELIRIQDALPTNSQPPVPTAEKERFENLEKNLDIVQETIKFLQDRYDNLTTAHVVKAMLEQLHHVFPTPQLLETKARDIDHLSGAVNGFQTRLAEIFKVLDGSIRRLEANTITKTELEAIQAQVANLQQASTGNWASAAQFVDLESKVKRLTSSADIQQEAIQELKSKLQSTTVPDLEQLKTQFVTGPDTEYSQLKLAIENLTILLSTVQKEVGEVKESARTAEEKSLENEQNQGAKEFELQALKRQVNDLTAGRERATDRPRSHGLEARSGFQIKGQANKRAEPATAVGSIVNGGPDRMSIDPRAENSRAATTSTNLQGNQAQEGQSPGPTITVRAPATPSERGQGQDTSAKPKQAHSAPGSKSDAAKRPRNPSGSSSPNHSLKRPKKFAKSGEAANSVAPSDSSRSRPQASQASQSSLESGEIRIPESHSWRDGSPEL